MFEFGDEVCFVFGPQVGVDFGDTCFGGKTGGGGLVVAGQHHDRATVWPHVGDDGGCFGTEVVADGDGTDGVAAALDEHRRCANGVRMRVTSVASWSGSSQPGRPTRAVHPLILPVNPAPVMAATLSAAVALGSAARIAWASGCSLRASSAATMSRTLSRV